VEYWAEAGGPTDLDEVGLVFLVSGRYQTMNLSSQANLDVSRSDMNQRARSHPTGACREEFIPEHTFSSSS
jgi:hypothetical protein